MLHIAHIIYILGVISLAGRAERRVSAVLYSLKGTQHFLGFLLWTFKYIIQVKGEEQTKSRRAKEESVLNSPLARHYHSAVVAGCTRAIQQSTQ